MPLVSLVYSWLVSFVYRPVHISREVEYMSSRIAWMLSLSMLRYSSSIGAILKKVSLAVLRLSILSKRDAISKSCLIISIEQSRSSTVPSFLVIFFI